MSSADTISRQAATQTALEFIVEYLGGAFDEDFQRKLIERMNALSSARSEPQWIPCSERLPDHPENDDYYLVTIQCEHYDGWDDYVTGFAEWTKYGWDELSCYVGQIKVIAWTPLPEPYKEKDNERA